MVLLADVWPGLHEGQRPMDPPAWWIRLWEGRPRIAEEVRDEPTNAEGVDGAFARAAAPGVAPGVGEVR